MDLATKIQGKTGWIWGVEQEGGQNSDFVRQDCVLAQDHYHCTSNELTAGSSSFCP